MDYSTLLENVMDVSHVPFTHHNSVGKRENATPVVLELTTKDKKVASKWFHRQVGRRSKKRKVRDAIH